MIISRKRRFVNKHYAAANGGFGDSMKNIRFYKVWEEPFEVFGLLGDIEKNGFRRVPCDVAEKTSESVSYLARHTSGGRIRFRTDSPVVVLKITGEYSFTWLTTPMMIHGADLYIDSAHGSTFIGGIHPELVYESQEEIKMPEGEHDITVFLPLYGTVDSFEIGIPEGAKLTEHSKKYKNELPVVFYGSSITQGACASRPGKAYEAVMSREYNINYTSLGFSGAALAEDAIVEYMSGMRMAAFVSDYDHNAPTHEHLRNTYHKLYEAIRRKNPDIPYFMVTRPNFYFDEDAICRRDIIMNSYLEARAAGDKNVYFIDGSAFFNGRDPRDLTPDLTHPNDEGYALMAKYIGDVISKVMKY